MIFFFSQSTFKVSNDNEQKTDPDNTVLEAFLLRLSSSLFCSLCHHVALLVPLLGLDTSL